MPSPYNCDGPQPPVPDNNDITGQGVIANYVATAGIAVLLIIIYFFVVYDPALDPFRKTDQDSSNHSFRPNPVDEIILRTVRHIPKRLMGDRKCILAMSDLQIVTGLSILISGYAQLHQGISSYHWMVIVGLAWFSSLTHLACLTLLRNHLYSHPLQRIWRLFCMAALVILLTIALSFTGGYWWSSLQGGLIPDEEMAWSIIRHAMCHSGFDVRSTTAYYAMVLSILLVIFGFVARIIKLHKIISVGIWEKARARLSMQARRLLRIAFIWCCPNNSYKSLKRTLLYRPLLTVFLVARLFLDGWSSMFSEVCWLVLGFIWGTMRLFGILGIIKKSVYRYPGEPTSIKLVQDSDERDGDWGFGQVVALVLLLAPLFTIIKYFNHDYKQRPGVVTGCSDRIWESSHSRSQSMNLTVSSFTPDTSMRPDDPNSNWDDHAQTLGAAIIYFMLICTITLFLICTYNSTANLIDHLQVFYLPVIIALMSIWELVIFSLTIELDLSNMPLWVQRLLHLVNILFFTFGAFFTLMPFYIYHQPSENYSFTWVGTYSFLISAAVFYILCAVLYRILGHTS
ncbi:hypothetical protein N7536_006561 [Penicillium majusculum]|nr:hypothetical protein N7536_006561 [Penicillium majusculum]